MDRIILSDLIFAYVVVGITLGMGVIYWALNKGHVTNEHNIEKFVFLGMLFFVFCWPLFIFVILYLVAKHWKDGT